MLALPGGAYVYQGEELGLEEVTDLPEELLQDPTWERSGHQVRGRDGSRVPIPWELSGPSLGFGSAPGWLPQPQHWGPLSVAAQQGDGGSTLSLYRRALQLRRELLTGESMRWLDSPGTALAFARDEGHGEVVCLVNFGRTPLPLPNHNEVLLASDEIDHNRAIPPDTAVWLR